jgi:hypothetical protein
VTLDGITDDDPRLSREAEQRAEVTEQLRRLNGGTN